jgi:hypothetical protein
MTTSQHHVAALRALLRGEDETFERLAATPDFHDGGGFPILVANAFYAAAQRRFPPGEWSPSDVVRFVGHLRARTVGELENLSATAAEQMLTRALGGTPLAGEFDETTRGVAQMALLIALVSELDGQELDTFLAGARERADAWAAQHNLQ